MMITDAIRHAQTDYVIHFLLTAYFEARAHSDTTDTLPSVLKRLPFKGRSDLAERLHVLRAASLVSAPQAQVKVETEAMEILSAAWLRLGTLAPLLKH